MKTVAKLIKELEQYPPDAYVAAYSAEATGIVIYPVTFGTYHLWDQRSNKADESIGFIDLYYDDMEEKRPRNEE
jgi:hypothetical protein